MKQWISMLLCMTLGMGSALAGSTWYVATNGLDSAAGTSWATALRSFTTAIVVKAAADAGDVILVSNGTYTANANGGVVVSGATNIAWVYKNVTVKSLNGPEVTIMDCGGILSNRAFLLQSASAAIDGFTISNGNTSAAGGYGGGIYATDCTGMVINCVFVNCVSETGGGMRIASAVLVTNCTFRNNTAVNGGGLYVNSGIISNCTFVGNSQVGASGNGGGGCYAIYYGQFYNCVFSNNTSSNKNGGGMYAQAYTGVVDTCVFVTNSAGNQGGGFYFSAGGYVRNCDIVQNVSTNEYGGFYLGSTNAMITDSRIVSNVALANSGGGGGGSGIISNCLVSGNSATKSGFGGGGLYCNLSGNPGGGIFNCTIIENKTSDYGGGARFYSGGEMRNCLVARNTCTTFGGGVYCCDAYAGRNALIQSCTIVSNTGGYGGGIYVKGQTNVILNTIVYSNAATYGPNVDVYLSACTNFFTNCCTPGVRSESPATDGIVLPVAAGNITNNPELVSVAGGDYHLSWSSPCINAGIYQNWMTGATDLDGRKRLDRISGRVDIGAYEYICKGTIFTVR